MHPLSNFFRNVPHRYGIYGYLYLSKRSEDLLGIIPEFNTIGEILDDLELIKNSEWVLSASKVEDCKFTKYTIVANGFLTKD